MVWWLGVCQEAVQVSAEGYISQLLLLLLLLLPALHTSSTINYRADQVILARKRAKGRGAWCSVQSAGRCKSVTESDSTGWQCDTAGVERIFCSAAPHLPTPCFAGDSVCNHPGHVCAVGAGPSLTPLHGPAAVAAALGTTPQACSTGAGTGEAGERAERR